MHHLDLRAGRLPFDGGRQSRAAIGQRNGESVGDFQHRGIIDAELNSFRGGADILSVALPLDDDALPGGRSVEREAAGHQHDRVGCPGRRAGGQRQGEPGDGREQEQRPAVEHTIGGGKDFELAAPARREPALRRIAPGRRRGGEPGQGPSAGVRL